MKIKHFAAIVLGAAFAAISTTSFAKLPAPPAPTEEQKAKAAEVKEKAAEVAKKDAADLGRYQDRAAARYFAAMKAAGKNVPPSTWVPPAPPAAVPAATAPAAPAAAPDKKA